MPVEVMNRSASDNRYLHRDFHLSLNTGIDYLYKTYTMADVEIYLTRFASNFYAPVIERIKKGGLEAAKTAFLSPYEAEDEQGVVTFTERKGEVIITISECPAVRHFNAKGVAPSPFYPLTTTIVWTEICRQAGLGFQTLSYDPKTGAAQHIIYEK